MKPTILWCCYAAVVTVMACGPVGSGSKDDGPDGDTGDGGIATDGGPPDGAVDVVVEDLPPADVATDPGPAEVDGGPECPPLTGARPSRRSEHAGIYDPVDQRVIFYGGSFAIPENCSFAVKHTFETEIWSYDVACDQWRAMENTGVGPGGRTRHMAAYDSFAHRMLVFGGRWRPGLSGTYTFYNDVWALDLATETWWEVPTSGVGPTPRVNGALVYDSGLHRLLLFGGNTDYTGMGYASQNDLWALDLSSGAWSVLQSAGPSPSPRLFMGAIWDQQRQWMVLFGGADDSAFFDTATYFDDLYALDFSGVVPAWNQLNAPGALRPDGRFWSSLVLDEARDRYVLFGGHDDQLLGNRNDLWAFDPKAWAWQQLDVGDTWNKPANGFCDFPPDFTNVDYEAPERRNSAVFVAGGDAAWLTGGKTDCGVVDDLVRLDLNDHTWEDVTTATVGVSCLRRGGLTCNDLCF